MIDSSYDEKILACLTKSQKLASVLISAGIQPEHFDTANKQNYARLCISFFKKYNVLFTDLSFVTYLHDLIEQKRISKDDKVFYLEQYTYYSSLDISDGNYFVDKVIEYIKYQEYKQLFEESITKHLPNGNFQAIESKFNKIKSLGAEQPASMMAYFDDVDKRIQMRQEGVNIGISTGIPQLDENLYHKGFGRGELAIILGAAKMGKTHSLLYFAQQASFQGYNVVYFSCEVSVNILADRLDTSYSDIFYDELQFAHDRVKDALSQIRKEKTVGEIFLFYYPTKTLTVTQAANVVERLENERNCKIDMVIFDYGDIMRPETTGDKRLQIGDIFERMRGFAGEKGVVVLSASQLNRDGAKKNVAQATDIAEDFSKIMTADLVVGLNASESEFAQGKIRVSIVANRNGGKRTFVIQSNYAKMRFFDGFVEYESF
jgi:replicative DNA helicase